MVYLQLLKILKDVNLFMKNYQDGKKILHM